MKYPIQLSINSAFSAPTPIIKPVAIKPQGPAGAPSDSNDFKVPLPRKFGYQNSEVPHLSSNSGQVSYSTLQNAQALMALK